MTKEEFVKSIRETAEEYFRSGTYFCSEAVLQTINDALGQPMPEDGIKFPHRDGQGSVPLRSSIRRRNGVRDCVRTHEGSADEPQDV